LSQWDGPQFQPPYPPSRQSSWALPVILVLVGVLGIIGIGYGVLKVTRPTPTTSEGLPTGDETPAGGGTPGGAAGGANAGGGGGSAQQVPDDAAHSMPSAPTLLGRCRGSGTPAERAAAATATFRVAYRDLAGYQVWVGSPQVERICGFHWDGTADDSTYSVPTAGRRDSGFLDGSGGVSVTMAAALVQHSNRWAAVSGRVSKDVSRVRIVWSGTRPPTEAVLNKEFYLARVVEPGLGHGADQLEKGCRVEAYNAAGDLAGHQPCSTFS
jgi:hypothetical protein